MLGRLECYVETSFEVESLFIRLVIGLRSDLKPDSFTWTESSYVFSCLFAVSPCSVFDVGSSASRCVGMVRFCLYE